MNEKIPEINIKEELKKVRDKGFIKNKRKGNTGIGYTLEEELGIPENNLGEPDFTFEGESYELKAQRADASSRVTLITKTPNWSPLSAKEIIEKYGYKDEQERQALKITLTTKFNSKDLKLEVDKESNRLNIVHKEGGTLCYFSIDELMEKIKTKYFSNLLLVIAERKQEEEIEYFHYKKAFLLKKLSEGAFEDSVEKDLIVFEFRMDIRERDKGKGNFFVRDHGPGFRMGRIHIDKLFEEKEEIL